jgi:hypothetical protein
MVPPVTKLYAVALLLLNLGACASKPPAAEMHHDMMMMSPRADTFVRAIRNLWAEDVILMRLQLLSATNGTGDPQQIAANLARKQDDIAAAIRPYYGDAVAQKLDELLKEPRTHENSAAIAVLLKQPSLAALLDGLQSVDKKNLDASFTQAMAVADAMAHGIIMQFPDRF